VILQVVSVRDSATEGFGRPVFVQAVGQALRSFGDEINRVAGDNDLNKHPEHFDLYHLGTFDDELGLVAPLEFPKLLASGKDLVR
jgi:hypothetical protein